MVLLVFLLLAQEVFGALLNTHKESANSLKTAEVISWSSHLIEGWGVCCQNVIPLCLFKSVGKTELKSSVFQLSMYEMARFLKFLLVESFAPLILRIVIKT